jgi:queuosine precursor transporter
MHNELIFVAHSMIISAATLCALFLGAEALVTLICTYCLLANILVIKQITLFGLHATGADAFTIGATLGLNMLQEYYGKKIASRTIVINFFVLLLYLLMSQIHLWYMPNASDTMHVHFNALFAFAPRIIIASFVVYLMAQTIDYHLYGLLKKHWSKRFLVIRNYTSIMISQLFDTIAFSFLGLYGIVDHIGEIIVISYTIKLLALLLSTPCIALSRRIARIAKHPF